MLSQFSNVFIFGMVAGIATILGMLLVLFFEKPARKYSTLLISFAAGALLAVAFNDLIPESLHLNTNALFFVLAGFFLFYLIEHFVVLHTCREEHCPRHKRLGLIAIFGLFFHSLIDGFIIGVGFGVDFKIGLVATLGVILHEFPEGITTLSILLHSKVKRRKAIMQTILVALATPIGAIISFFLLKGVSENFLGILLAFAAGSFLYIASADLIPEIHEKFNIFNALAMFLGILALLVLSIILG